MKQFFHSEFLLPKLWTGWRRWAAICACLIVIILLGDIRSDTDAELAFATLALLPVLVIAWIGGRRLGLITAFLAGAMWLVSDFYSDRTFSASWIPWVNALMRGFTYGLVVLLAAEVRVLLERERKSATVDALTGLLNRRALLSAGTLEVERAKRYGGQLAVVFLDLDNFKTLNDTNGHHAGDQALQITGKALLESTRQNDIVSRIGGDEFAVVFPDIGYEAAVTAGEKLFLNVNLALDQFPPVRASMGVAWFRDADLEFPAMLNAADELMYTVKAAGKNKIIVRRYPDSRLLT